MSIPHELFAFSTETVRLILIHCHLPIRRQTSDRPRFSPLLCTVAHIRCALPKDIRLSQIADDGIPFCQSRYTPSYMLVVVLPIKILCNFYNFLQAMIAFMTTFHIRERQEKKFLLSAAEDNTQDLLRHGVSDIPILSYVFSYV